MQKMEKGHGGSVMAWGTFPWHGLGALTSRQGRRRALLSGAE